MASLTAYDQPTKVSPVEGEVVLEGPDGIGLSMTPEAAEETARRLSHAAKIARRQVAGRDPDGDATN